MRYLGVPVLLCLAACGAAPSSNEDPASTGSDLQGGTKLTFTSAFTQSVSGALAVGAPAAIVYAPSRLPTCRDSGPNGPEWAITGYYSVNGLPATSFAVAGLMPGGGPKVPVIRPPVAGDLQLWFQNTDASGCNAWDSAYGANYHFTVPAPANAPSWVGDATSVLDRDSCSGNPCTPGVVHALDAGFTFGTFARSQDGFAEAFFQVWKPGVTDFDNPDLWQELDVRLHAQLGGEGAFTTNPVSFYQRLGNNAQYGVDLRVVDPLAAPSGKLTRKSQCPTFPTTVSADGQTIQTTYDFYMTVNGVAVQPAAGGLFHGVFQNYAGLYAICLPQ